MTSRRRRAARAAALGTACFFVSLLVPAAQATGSPPPIYTGRATGQGIVTTFAVRPSIFDPLLQGGLPFTESTISSQGGGASHAVAAQLFPGSFAIGAVGCGGLKGWVQANYPPAGPCHTDQNDTVYQTPVSNFGSSLGRPEIDDALNAVLGRTTLTLGEMRAHAELPESFGAIRTLDYTLRDDLDSPPLVHVGDVQMQSRSALEGDALVNEVVVTTKDVSLMNGAVTIGTLVSRARGTSDGTVGAASSSLSAEDVDAVVNGERYRATIDESGIAISDPALSREQNASLTRTFEASLDGAGISIRLGSSSNLVDGASADATVGGLIVAISGTIPAIRYPSEITPVIGAAVALIPALCGTDIEKQVDPSGSQLPQVPLCFGAGVVPNGGSELVGTVTFGAAEAFSAGSLGWVPPAGGPIPCPSCSGGGSFSGGTFAPPGSAVGPPSTVPSPGRDVTTQPNGPLLGIFARMPSALLLGLGLGLLVLAVGAALGPSLRHGRAD